MDDNNGITALHSSPHDFDEFDTAKIGTGEGNQVYGHGLYFAENPKVSGQGGQYWNQFWNKMKSGPERSAASALWANKFDRDKAIAHLDKEHAYYLDQAKPGRYAYGPDIEEGHRILAEESKAAADHLRSGQIAGPRTYEVHIDAHPDHFLDWDKPLSEQHEVGKKLFESRKENPTLWGHTSEALNNDDTVENFYKKLSVSHPYGQKGASEWLQRAGIHGIKYLDAGSRGPTEQPTSNYVVFDHNRVKVKRKYEQGGFVDGFDNGGSVHGDYFIPHGDPRRAANLNAFDPVRDEQGAPRVFYHGTRGEMPNREAITPENFRTRPTFVPRDIKSFKTDETEMGSHFGTVPQSSEFHRDIYSDNPGMIGDHAQTYPVHLSIKNPIRFQDRKSFHPKHILSQLIDKGISQSALSKIKLVGASQSSIQDYLKSKGHDGIVYLNRFEGLNNYGNRPMPETLHHLSDEAFKKIYPEAQDSYIAFDPHQIKSALGNRGTFSKSSPHLNENRGGAVEYKRGGNVGHRHGYSVDGGVPESGATGSATERNTVENGGLNSDGSDPSTSGYGNDNNNDNGGGGTNPFGGGNDGSGPQMGAASGLTSFGLKGVDTSSMPTDETTGASSLPSGNFLGNNVFGQQTQANEYATFAGGNSPMSDYRVDSYDPESNRIIQPSTNPTIQVPSTMTNKQIAEMYKELSVPPTNPNPAAPTATSNMYNASMYKDAPALTPTSTEYPTGMFGSSQNTPTTFGPTATNFSGFNVPQTTAPTTTAPTDTSMYEDPSIIARGKMSMNDTTQPQVAYENALKNALAQGQSGYNAMGAAQDAARAVMDQQAMYRASAQDAQSMANQMDDAAAAEAARMDPSITARAALLSPTTNKITTPEGIVDPTIEARARMLNDMTNVVPQKASTFDINKAFPNLSQDAAKINEDLMTANNWYNTPLIGGMVKSSVEDQLGPITQATPAQEQKIADIINQGNAPTSVPSDFATQEQLNQYLTQQGYTTSGPNRAGSTGSMPTEYTTYDSNLNPVNVVGPRAGSTANANPANAEASSDTTYTQPQRAGSMGSMPTGMQAYDSNLNPIMQAAQGSAPQQQPTMQFPNGNIPLPPERMPEETPPTERQGRDGPDSNPRQIESRRSFNRAYAAAKAAGKTSFEWTDPVTGETKTYPIQARATGGRTQKMIYPTGIVEHALAKISAPPPALDPLMVAKRGRPY